MVIISSIEEVDVGGKTFDRDGVVPEDMRINTSYPEEGERPVYSVIPVCILSPSRQGDLWSDPVSEGKGFSDHNLFH